MKPRVLIIDDEKNIRRTLSMILRSAGYSLREAGSGEEGVAALEEKPADVVLLDVGLPGQDGIETLKQIKAAQPRTGVIMISGQATVQIAVEATKYGAFDFLEKPLSKDRVLIALRNAVERSSLDSEITRYQKTEAERRAMVGSSEPIEQLRAQVAKVAPTPATVLVTGESGSGKELVARAVHDASPRSSGPFVKVNCAAIPEELIESELFGAIKGAFTGADRNRDGKFIVADGGTLFLDEIGDMSLKVQAKVLRALQEKEIERVGDSKVIKVDVRVVAATNKNLMEEVEAGRFREDLFYRLNVVPVHVPPLRERREDVVKLSQHFLALYAAENELPAKTLGADALDALASRPWRGNIRELKNVIERLAILSDGPRITAADVEGLAPSATGGASTVVASETPSAAAPPSSIAASGGGWHIPTLDDIRELGGLVQARREFERRCIAECLDRTGGNVSQAARWLGVERSNLHKKMQAFGLGARGAREEDA